MISSILATNPPLVRVLFWVGLALGIVAGWLLYRMRRQRALAVLAVISLLGPLALTFSPSSAEPESFCILRLSVPFQGIDTLANLAMLLPLALFAALLLRRPLAVFAAASGMSAVIELVQALVPALGRTCDTDDWFMNTAGAALGALLASCIIAVDKRRDHNPVEQLH